MKFLCWMFGHRWWFVDCAARHKDFYECSRCGEETPAYQDGKYLTLTHLESLGEKFEYWDHEKKADVVIYKRD